MLNQKIKSILILYQKIKSILILYQKIKSIHILFGFVCILEYWALGQYNYRPLSVIIIMEK